MVGNLFVSPDKGSAQKKKNREGSGAKILVRKNIYLFFVGIRLYMGIILPIKGLFHKQ